MFKLILSDRGKVMKNPVRDFWGTYLQCALNQITKGNLPE